MSRRELADAVNAYLWQTYGVEEHLDDNDIGKLERGVHRWPGAGRREAFRAVLGAETDADLGFYVIRGRDGARRANRVAARSDHSGDLSGVSDVAVIADLRSLLATSRRLDHRAGSLAALPIVAAQRSLVAELVRPKASRLLLGLLAELRQFHGWLLFDTGDHTRARAELTAAHQVAAEAGDDALTAYILGPNLGLTEMYGGHPRHGLEHARAAVTVARRTGNQRLAAFTLAIAARCSARLGDEDATRQLLDDAAAALGRHRQSDAEPAWLSVFDRAALSGHAGSCLLDLGAPADATRLLTDQASSSHDVFVRNRALWLLDRACAHREMGEMDRATADVRDALVVASATTSPRVRLRAVRVAAALRQRHNTPSTRRLVAAARARHGLGVPE